MKQEFVFSFCVFVVALFVLVLPLFAAGAADYYAVTITKLELYNGTTWITVFTGTSSELDIASVSSGQAVGNFLSNLVVPDGTYTQVRATPSPTMKIRGTDGLGNYTTAASGPFGGCVATADINQEATYTITLTGGNIPLPNTHDFSATPITVTDGVANHSVRVTFNVASAIENIGGELWPAAPTVNMTVQ